MDSIVTIITPAPTLDLTVLATVKSKLGITGITEDTKISAWIKEASDFIASYCNRCFGKQTISESFRLDGSSTDILLSQFPVGTVTSITAGDVVLATDEWEMDKAKGILYRVSGSSRLVWGAYRTTIVYQAGYTLMGELPYDIEAACIELIKEARSASTRDPLAKRIEIPDVETVDYWVGGIGDKSFGLPAQVKTTLDNYRKHH